MCGRLHLTFMLEAAEMFERLFGMPFPTFEYPPILSDDVLPFHDITSIYSNFGQTAFEVNILEPHPKDFAKI